jgi:hypothetical protein
VRRSALAAATGWIVLAMIACEDPPDALETRCLEALAYRSPHHGEVESMERSPTEAGTAVSIRYRVEATPGKTPYRFVVCEFAEGDRWALHQMIYEGQVLPEPELALVNSDLLLQDLTDNPQRFEERKHLVPKPAAPEKPTVAPHPVTPPRPVAATTPARDSDGIVESPPVRTDSAEVRVHAGPRSDRMGSPNPPLPDPNPPAAPEWTPAPATQIPSPSSGGSD